MVLGCLTGMDTPLQWLVWPRVQGDKIGIKKCRTQIPCSPFNPEDLSGNSGFSLIHMKMSRPARTFNLKEVIGAKNIAGMKMPPASLFLPALMGSEF
jgi:hypothetical protein